MDYPEFLHHGAVGGVTGSCHQLLMDARHSLLIDCGLFQGAETSAEGKSAADRLAIEFPLDSIKALVATHVHIDHVGCIPYLLAAGFKAPILCSEPSTKLLPIVLENAFKLGFSRDQKQVERYIKLIEQRIIALPYNAWFTLQDSESLVYRIRLQRAGHILGSAYVEIDLHYPARREKKRIVFSGDLGAPHAPLLRAPKSPCRADILVIESTHGDRLHENRYACRHRLESVIEQALASRLTWVYRELKPFWDNEALQRVKQGRNSLSFSKLLTVDSQRAHLAMVNRLAQTAQPVIVIAGNGMCSSGRIVNYLKAMLHDPRHDVLFVGYQAQGTPERAIQVHGPSGGYVELDGERYTVGVKITTIGGYSAHADQKGLLGFVTRMRHWPSDIRIVHGDATAKVTLAERSRRIMSRRDVKCGSVSPLRTTQPKRSSSPAAGYYSVR